jgi:hypothetical protein
VTLSAGLTGINASTLTQINALIRKAFERMEELDSRHVEVVESNLRTDVIIIGKAGEEGQKIKKELESSLLRLLPKDRTVVAQLVVTHVAGYTSDFGSKFRAIYTQPSEAGFKFVIGSFNDVMIKDFEAFKKSGYYKDISNARNSVSFTAPSPPFFLKKYFTP